MQYEYVGIRCNPGAHPGIFVRGGGGPTFPKNHKKNDKKGKERREGNFSIFSALV